MHLGADEKYGLSCIPTGCECQSARVTSVNFQDVYDFIILEAIEKANAALASEGMQIKCSRGEDLAQGGNIVSQFLQQICRAEITITDVTGLNPNVLLEYGIRLSVRDSLNILICHRGVVLPIDIADQRYIEYTQEPAGVRQAKEDIVRQILHAAPALRRETAESTENLFRRTVELATGRHLERRLAQAIATAPALVAELANEQRRLSRIDSKLRDRIWNFLEELAGTLHADPLGPQRAIEVYRLLTTLDGFHEKRRDIFYKLNEICASDPDRAVEAEEYLMQAKALDD